MCKVSTTPHFVRRTLINLERQNHWVPNTDIYTTDEGLVIKLELAGMKSENLRITVEDNKLRIAGERPDNCRGAKFNFLAMEINYGLFENVLELPPGYDLADAKASYLNGFLRIDVPVLVRATTGKRTKVAVVDQR